METEKSGKSGFMAWYFQSNLLTRILIGLILGAVVGLIAGPSIAGALWAPPLRCRGVECVSLGILQSAGSARR